MAIVAASAIGVLMTACGSGGGTGTKTSNPVTPTVTVTTSASTLTNGQAFSITIAVAGPSGDTTPTGSIALSLGSNSLPAGTLAGGSLTVGLPSGSWSAAPGSYQLTASYTPDSSSSSTYTSASGKSGTLTVEAPPTTYQLSVNSTLTGTPVSASPADVNGNTVGQIPAIFTYDAGTSVTVTATTPSAGYTFTSWTGCASTSGTICTVTMNASTSITANYTPTTGPGTALLTVDSTNPSSGVAINVALSGSSNNLGTTTPFSITGSTGAVYTLTAPATENGAAFGSWTGGCASTNGNQCVVTLNSNTTVTANYTVKPTVTVTPQSYTLASQDSLQVTVTVAGPGGDPTPTGTVVLKYGTTWSSSPSTLSSGSYSITVPAETLPSGSDTLTAAYTPDTGSAGIYSSATGTSNAITVGAATAINVDESSVGAATTDQILGVNLEAWYDVVANAGFVTSGMQNAGMQALRWPGGSWSDAYHWTGANQHISGDATTQPYMCDTSTGNEGKFSWGGNADEDFSDFETSIAKAGSGFDLALTANYGSNETCNGGGDPNEAASWAAAAVADGHPASHITIGNEEYGSWEFDLHATQHDPTTYANAVIGTSGYYDLIKAQSPTTMVGVVVDANCTSSSGCTNNWDTTMLPLAKGFFDFVEYHYYPQYGTPSTDTYLVHQAALDFTTNINKIKNELAAPSVGEPNTPIYVGEVGSNSADPVKQSWSITQALYAGQMLGEAMNDGVSRLTWWDGYGNCFSTNPASPSESGLYGWQNWGAQDIFSAGADDTSAGCTNDGAAGTPSPTAQAFNLFKNVAVNGENVLAATVTGGDTTNVRAYAATHSGGTALVLFNLNQTTAEPVEITLSSSTTTTDLKVITYDKEIYDYTDPTCQTDPGCTYDPNHDYSSIDWAGPVTTDVGSTNLPYTLVLQPWSMNVVIIK